MHDGLCQRHHARSGAAKEIIEKIKPARLPERSCNPNGLRRFTARDCDATQLVSPPGSRQSSSVGPPFDYRARHDQGGHRGRPVTYYVIKPGAELW